MSYEDRAQNYGLVPTDELKQVLQQDPRAVLLDVRSEEEIESSGKFQFGDHRWVQAACTATSAEELIDRSDSLLPDKDAPVIVYCKSGRRASTAKQALEERGYKRVLNVGGYDDVKNMGLV